MYTIWMAGILTTVDRQWYLYSVFQRVHTDAFQKVVVYIIDISMKVIEQELEQTKGKFRS